jgi:hypothetical protein
MAAVERSPRRRAVVAALLLGLAGAVGCARAPNTGAVAIPPIPPGKARIWVFREFLPSESLNLAAVSFNGSVIGYAQAAGGAFYRDVSPGRYLITVASYGRDFSQSSEVDLAAGDEAYIQIESLNAWTTGGEMAAYRRDTFYARLVLPDQARAAIARLPFDGGS